MATRCDPTRGEGLLCTQTATGNTHVRSIRLKIHLTHWYVWYYMCVVLLGVPMSRTISSLPVLNYPTMMLRLMPVAMTTTDKVSNRIGVSPFSWWYLSSNCSICNLFIPEYGGFGSVSGKIEIDIKINHEGEVNRSVDVASQFYSTNCQSLSVRNSIHLSIILLLLPPPLPPSLPMQSSLHASESIHHSHQDSIGWCARLWLLQTSIKTWWV